MLVILASHLSTLYHMYSVHMIYLLAGRRSDGKKAAEQSERLLLYEYMIIAGSRGLPYLLRKSCMVISLMQRLNQKSLDNWMFLTKQPTEYGSCIWWSGKVTIIADYYYFHFCKDITWSNLNFMYKVLNKVISSVKVCLIWEHNGTSPIIFWVTKMSLSKQAYKTRYKNITDQTC